METNSFFCQLLKQLPQTLFELIGLPAERAKSYRFDSVEVKKSFRIDGLFLPREPVLPVYFVEVQFRRLQKFYANLFAKVFCFLEENDPKQDWVAVAIFPNRHAEPKHLGPYEDLLEGNRVKRIFLDELAMPPDPPLGLGILQLVSAPVNQVQDLVARLRQKAKIELADSDLGASVVQLLEELLIRRFAGLSREEIRGMIQLHDLRETRVWQEAQEEAQKMLKTKLVKRFLAKNIPLKQIADLLDIRLQEARRLAKENPVGEENGASPSD